VATVVRRFWLIIPLWTSGTATRFSQFVTENVENFP
jgi:hypothetical protein